MFHLLIGIWVVNDAFPKKSQADSQNPTNASSDVSNQPTFPPVSAIPPSDASASPSTLVAPSIITENSDSTVVHSDSKLEGTVLDQIFNANVNLIYCQNFLRRTAFRTR